MHWLRLMRGRMPHPGSGDETQRRTINPEYSQEYGFNLYKNGKNEGVETFTHTCKDGSAVGVFQDHHVKRRKKGKIVINKIANNGYGPCFYKILDRQPVLF